MHFQLQQIFLKSSYHSLEILFLLYYLPFNKLESSNKFGKAVFYGKNQEFQQPTKEEQLIADGCKRLIENSIICWNYLYLSKLIHDTESENEKKKLINIIKNGSVIAWGHINLQGEFDFSDEILKDSIGFQLPELLEVTVH